jgi:beta-1,4-mannosyl-glycoprotein beta-1,4-N-acetylglucosaminyltransferase
MVYDCFPFFNELDLLELRLNELKDVVDKHVLVESPRTFQQQPKPLYYKENKERYKDFHHKIIHIVLDDLVLSDPWRTEFAHRDIAWTALMNCKDDDVIIIADADEIISPSAIHLYQQNPYKRPKALTQKAYYYWMNCLVSQNCAAPVITDYASLKNYNRLSHIRLARDSFDRMYRGGWHFAYLGGVDRIIQKIKAFAHSEFNNPEFLERSRLEKIINEGANLFDGNDGVFVPLDKSFPAYLLQNQAKFAQYLKL